MDAQHTTHRTDAAPAYTAGSLDSAAQVLQRADGSTPAPVLSLTDEQLAGMDGDRAGQLTALPWLAENTEDIEGDTTTGRRAFAAGVGLRSLVASGLVRIVADPIGTDGDGTGSRWQAAPVLDGCLVLRRAANMVTSVERTMNTPSGPQVNRLYYYTIPAGCSRRRSPPPGSTTSRRCAPNRLRSGSPPWPTRRESQVRPRAAARIWPFSQAPTAVPTRAVPGRPRRTSLADWPAPWR